MPRGESQFNGQFRWRHGLFIGLLVLAGWSGVCHARLAAAAPDPALVRRVVLLYDERIDLPGMAVLDANLVTTLTSDPGVPLEVYREAMDLSRFGSDTYVQLLRDHLRAKYAAKKVDAVVAVMGPALDFLLGAGDSVFPGAAVVFCGIDRREIERRTLPSHVTGVVLKREFLPTLQLALRLHPDAARVLFIGGTSEFDARLVDQARQEFREYEGRLAFTYLTALPIHELVERVAKVPPQTVVLISTVFRDGAGAAVVPHEVVERLTAAANVPIFGFSDQFLGRGIVGGQVYSVSTHGQQAAALVRQILAGRKPSELGFMESPSGVVAFDGRQLARWRINEARLPAGSTILHKEPGPWDLYRPQIIAGIVVLLLQSAGIAALLIQRARRLRVEKALHDGQQRYSVATAAGAVGVWEWDFEKNEVYVDPTLKAILGFTDAEISRRADDWGARIHPGDLELVTARTQACIEGRVDEYEVEHRMMHRDGSVRWFLSRGSLVRRPDGSPHRMVGTKVDITERRLAADAIRENEAILQATNEELQDLAGRLIASQEAERARFARDLHDDLSQQLAALSIALSGLKRRIASLPVPVPVAIEGDVSSIQARAIALATNMRRLSHDLHPTVLERAGLIAVLEAHCQDLHGRNGLDVAFEADGDFSGISGDAALCIYRVAQEALRNVVSHARAAHARVLVGRHAGTVELCITDDGRGFDILRTGERARGLGLISINERVRLVGGTVAIMTERNNGTRVHVAVPAHSAAPAVIAGPLASSA
jgi:PAS domain S-box-containing protein